MKVLVTGGTGFIGSALVRYLVGDRGDAVVNVDILTYAANPFAVAPVETDSRYSFERADIADATAMARIFKSHRPDAVVHLAAETHVDRSIDGPAAFISTNINGTHVLLEAALEYWSSLDAGRRDAFRFLHVSTDEVYGSLGDTGRFSETDAYAPNSPYAASKAASDHLARAWHRTFGLPVIVTNCTNNYGPYQFPEKLIPIVIVKALGGEAISVYGDGGNVRDWLYVEDHVRALHLAIEHGVVGECYNIGGDCEKTNIEVVKAICALLDEMVPESRFRPHERLIQFVADRPGHDRRYAMDSAKIERELGWRARENFASGLRRTVEWYLANRPWWESIHNTRYRGERLGLGAGVETIPARPEPQSATHEGGLNGDIAGT